MNEIQFTTTKLLQQQMLTSNNALVTAAMPLLLLMIRFKSTQTHQQPVELRNQVVNEISIFENKAKNLGCSQRIILAARYCICTALDEIALCTQWGSNSDWSQQTLLSIIQKETWGGERFFIILDKMAEDPQQNLSILELFYILLSLGYEGKYYDEGKSIRDEILHRLFRTIIMYREPPSKMLSPSKSKITSLPIVKKQKPIWPIAAATAGILFFIGFIFNYATASQANITLQQLEEISQTIPMPIKPTKKAIKRTKKLRHFNPYYFYQY